MFEWCISAKIQLRARYRPEHYSKPERIQLRAHHRPEQYLNGTFRPQDPVARAILNGTFRPNDPAARKIHLRAHRRPEQYLNGTFRPNDPVARKIQLRAHRSPEQYSNGTFQPSNGTFRPNDPVARKIQLPEQIQLRARYGPVGYWNGDPVVSTIKPQEIFALGFGVRYPEWCIREVDLEEPFRGQKNSYGAMVLAEWE
ncbi:hypothetical protein B0H16DRAFT_1682802 [Mycena metata]|uniref:Uncharacterized protein n=1 Tax=Mycena metata TaxID=1033252 RepID=A0AAD7KA38_9AGAR|nr:hypothetical protein B0H16DRAFT_1682802 [Mycena metata]